MLGQNLEQKPFLTSQGGLKDPMTYFHQVPDGVFSVSRQIFVFYSTVLQQGFRYGFQSQYCVALLGAVTACCITIWHNSEQYSQSTQKLQSRDTLKKSKSMGHDIFCCVCSSLNF